MEVIAVCDPSFHHYMLFIFPLPPSPTPNPLQLLSLSFLNFCFCLFSIVMGFFLHQLLPPIHTVPLLLLCLFSLVYLFFVYFHAILLLLFLLRRGPAQQSLVQSVYIKHTARGRRSKHCMHTVD